jgi:hypothetical protein
MNRREIELPEIYESEDSTPPQELAYTILWMAGLLLIACMIAAGS